MGVQHPQTYSFRSTQDWHSGSNRPACPLHSFGVQCAVTPTPPPRNPRDHDNCRAPRSPRLRHRGIHVTTTPAVPGANRPSPNGWRPAESPAKCAPCLPGERTGLAPWRSIRLLESTSRPWHRDACIRCAACASVRTRAAGSRRCSRQRRSAATGRNRSRSPGVAREVCRW